MNAELLLKQYAQEIVYMGERTLKNYPYLHKSERQEVMKLLTKYRKLK